MLGLDQVREVFEAGNGLDEAGFNSFADTDEVQISGDGELTGNKLGAEFGQAFTLFEHDLHPEAGPGRQVFAFALVHSVVGLDVALAIRLVSS